MVSENTIKKLLAKLQSPVHFDYISENILKLDTLKTIEILNYLIEDEIIEQVEKQYYKLKQKK